LLDSIERVVPGLNALAVLSSKGVHTCLEVHVHVSKRRVRALRRHPPPHGRRCISFEKGVR
jgi:hypothetical protein